MGMVYRKSYTMPVPRGAEILEHNGQRIARWRLRNGQVRSGEVVDCKDGKLRVRGQSRSYIARYRDGRGEVVEVATNCKDVVAARAVLASLERRAELVRAGVMTPAEHDAASHADVPLAKHLDAYERHLKVKGCDARRILMLRRRIERLARECRFNKLNRMSGGPVERWLVERADEGMAAATRNSYREALICFANWCRRTHRLTVSPVENVPRADANVDRRHQRRALTEVELMRLLKSARLRPLAEYGREITSKDVDAKRSKKSRATWQREPLTIDNLDDAVERARVALKGNPDLIARLERTGRERALMYKALALTGLRKGELASLTVGQLDFGGPLAYAVLNPADEKNRRGSNIPLRADLADELASWLAERLRDVQEQARQHGEPIPARLPANTPLFNVPSGLTRIFDRDLAVAGIAKRDERDRVVDVHALRVTFGTHLCAAGIPLRTAQAAMRHSKPELTANIYTDPKLLDVAGAIDALPNLTLEPASRAVGASMKA
jgi:integrase